MPNNNNFLSFTFGSKNNNNLQLGTILNNKPSILESFFQIFNMASRYFSKNFSNYKNH